MAPCYAASTLTGATTSETTTGTTRSEANIGTTPKFNPNTTQADNETFTMPDFTDTTVNGTGDPNKGLGGYIIKLLYLLEFIHVKYKNKIMIIIFVEDLHR